MAIEPTDQPTDSTVEKSIISKDCSRYFTPRAHVVFFSDEIVLQISKLVIQNCLMQVILIVG